MGTHGLGDRNDNGERFVDFCNSNDLAIGGTLFPHKEFHKITWLSNDRVTKNQIDHFAISRRFRSCLMDVRSKPRADIGYQYDHRLVLAYVRLRTAAVLTNTTNNRKAPRYFIDRLKNQQCLKNFSEVLEVRSAVALSEPVATIEGKWESIKSIYHEVGKHTVGKPPKGYRPWISEKTWLLIQERISLKAKRNDAHMPESRSILENQ